ncbi:hypothetical protein B296_00045777 [Ensete ventricosum]|uniref:Uncharacterized protein n=1 Tax=Ensete ventricosum TaxID=4639 RepID=A0A426XN28_ENSVE|nr:hypothetical protein B296_00045777 [Ensete ventricosum]
MALRLKLIPKTLVPLRSLRPFSSSSTPPTPSDSDADNETSDSAAVPPRRPSYSSYFSEIKERLKAPPTPPRRIPADPAPPPPLSAPNAGSATSLEDIRKHLAGFRLRAGGAAPPASGDRPASSPPISFQELFKHNVLGKAGGGVEAGEKGEKLSFDSIRESLRQFRSSSREHMGLRGRDGPSRSSFSLETFQDSFRSRMGGTEKSPSILGGENLPDSIFGKELREKEAGEWEQKKVLKTDFVKMYSYNELGEKLRKLRPEDAAKANKDWFTLTELNERLAKLREMEEKETESRMGGVSFRDLRESLVRLKEADANKKANDHMSSAEKMKLELKRVRDEFKMSESDCGSAPVQGQALQEGTTADGPEKKEASKVSEEDRLGFLLRCAVKAWPQGCLPVQAS